MGRFTDKKRQKNKCLQNGEKYKNQRDHQKYKNAQMALGGKCTVPLA